MSDTTRRPTRAASRAGRRVDEPELRTLRFPVGLSETDFRLKVGHGIAFLAQGGALEVAVRGERAAAGELVDRVVAEFAVCAEPAGEARRTADEIIVVLKPRPAAGAERRSA